MSVKKRKLLISCVALVVLVSFAAFYAFAGKKEGKSDISGSIRLLCWEGYEFPEGFKSFTEKYNVTIDPTFISSNDEIFAKLKAGDEYDIVTPIQAYIYPLVEHDLLQPIDTTKIERYKNVNQKILGALKDFNFQGKVWGVPICFGKNDFVYNADKAKCISSWWDVLKPEWQGHYIMLDDAIGQITQAARAIGVDHDPSLLTPAEFQQCKDLLIKMKKGARSIVTSFGEAKSMLISGEANGWFSANIMIAAQAKKEGYNIWGCIPKEGTLIFIDSYCIPKNSPNPKGALALCNELLSQDVQITGVVDNLYCGAVTDDAIAKLNDEQKSLYPYDDLDEFFTQNILNGAIPLESDKYATFEQWVTMWEEVKASK
jgi:spermidine/putrescine transport system substrate-binding protein